MRLSVAVTCPGNETIAELVCRTLSDVKAIEIEAHVADCATCRRLVGTLAAASLPRLAEGSEPRGGEARVPAREPHRYVIREELARGGMGRISIADDTLLGRRVAIKELLAPTAALAARFQRELALTSRLQHPSIVSIHDGGTWSNGEPFYVMRLVSGEPLDRVISRHETAAARLGLLPHAIATVDALAYAHSQKIVHRDLKPANVLVGDYGETVVIDWGLARDLADPADDAKQIVGTPAYMSPEQARGEPTDARADVYALGAVLYHLFGGAPPYTGTAAAEIVQAVTAAPPPLLADRAEGIPHDLLAVVAKAMAREPADRYASAGELALDLKRFERGQLVGAHRYSRWQLARRWLARHRTAVAVGGIAAAVLAVVAIASVRRVVAEQHRAEHNRADAEELMTFMLNDLRDKLEPIGKLDLLRTVATKARDYYMQRPEERTVEARAKQVTTHENLGHVLQDQGDLAGALAEYREALRIAETLAVDEPATSEWQHDLSVDHRRIGEVLEMKNEEVAALVELRAALAVSDRAVARDSTNSITASDQLQSQLDVGQALATQGDTKAALAQFHTAIATAEQLRVKEPTNPTRAREVYMGHNYLGGLLERSGSGAEALAEYRTAKAIAVARVERTPTDAEALRDVWLTEMSLGRVLIAQGDDGLVELRAAERISEGLVAREPLDVVWQRDYSGTQNEIGNVLLARGDAAGALKLFRAGQEAIRGVAARAIDNADVQRDLEVSGSRVGTALEATGDLPAALVEYHIDLEIAERLATHDPTNENLMSDLAMAHNDLGSALQSHDELDGALAEFRASETVAKRLVAKDPSNAQLQRTLWAFEANIGDVIAAKDPTAAVAELRAATEIAKRLAEQQPNSAEAQGDLCTSHIKLGNALIAHGDLDEAVREERTALASATTLAAKDAENTAWQDLLVAAHGKLGDALAKQGSADAMVEYRAGLEIATALVRQEPGNADRVKAAAELRAHLNSGRR